MTTKIKLNKTALKAIKPPEKGQLLIWDSDLSGFGIRVNPKKVDKDTGKETVKITYIYQGRVNGKTKRITIGPADDRLTPEKARKEAIQIAGKLNSGIDPVAEKRMNEGQSTTLADAVDAYTGGRPLKESTIKDITRAMKALKEWKKIAIVDIKPSMIEAKHKELSKSGPTRANLTMRYLRAVLNDANARYSAEHGEPLLMVNPVKHLSTLKAWNRTSRRRTFIKPHELQQWANAVLHSLTGLKFADEIRDCLMLSILTGVRPTEALELTWSGVDFKGRVITFYDTKNHTDHELPMTKWVGAMLDSRKLLSADKFVFSDTKGKPLKDTRAGVTRIKQESEIDFMPSDLRRTFITTAERLDIGLYSLKRMLNHTIDSDVTAGYVVPTTDRIREPMQRVEDTLLKEAGLLNMGKVIELRAKG